MLGLAMTKGKYINSQHLHEVVNTKPGRYGGGEGRVEMWCRDPAIIQVDEREFQEMRE